MLFSKALVSPGPLVHFPLFLLSFSFSHLNDGDDAAEDADEAEELVGVVVADGVLQAHEGDAREEGARQRHHVADQTVATCDRKHALQNRPSPTYFKAVT